MSRQPPGDRPRRGPHDPEGEGLLAEPPDPTESELDQPLPPGGADRQDTRT